MDKTIQTKFLEAFKYGGVVRKCIDWMRYTYQLPRMKPSSQDNLKPESEKDKVLYKQLSKEILEAAKTFDDSVLYGDNSPLMNEIDANLKECQTEDERDRYLFSLLKPFGIAGCGIAYIYTPIAEISQLNAEICEYEKDIALWKADSEDSHAKEQIVACREMIKDRKAQIEWVNHVNSQFIDLTGRVEDGAKWMQEGTVESCLHAFVRTMRTFANRLDALLLTYGIDFLRLQNICGLYLKRTRLIPEILHYIGSWELAQEYINRLPKEPQQELEQLSPTINADEAKNIFQKDFLPNKPSKAAKRGRRSRAFMDCLQTGGSLQTIHTIMKGKRGKEAALVMKAAIQIGWITKPTFKAVEDEFGDIGNRSNYNKYMNGDKFTRDEIDGMKEVLLVN